MSVQLVFSWRVSVEISKSPIDVGMDDVSMDDVGLDDVGG